MFSLVDLFCIFSERHICELEYDICGRKELKVLKLDEMLESLWILYGIVSNNFIISVINGYGIVRFVYTIGVMLVLF